MRNSCLFLLILAMGVAGCRNNIDPHASEESSHSHGAGSVPYTTYSDSCEYFAEIRPVIKGEPSEATVHITKLSDHKPFSEGVMAVRVYLNDRLIGSGDTNKPRIPGIFPVKFTAIEAGSVTLRFVFEGGGVKDSATVLSAVVYESEEAAAKAQAADPSGMIRFTKEMAWKIDFHVMKVVPKEYFNTLRVGGELTVPPDGMVTVGAKADGILVYKMAGLVPGAKVPEGALLFNLTGQGLTTRNMDAGIASVRSRFESSKAAFEREKLLLPDRIVSEKQFIETRSRYRVDSIQYFSLLNGFSGNSMNIVAPAGGYIRQVHQSNGSFVTEGMPLITLGNTNKILLRADLPQSQWQELSLIRSAAFRPAGSSRVYDLDAIGGKMVARGSAVTADNPFIPVWFEFPNDGSFVAGTFAEVFLRTTALPGQLVIPVSALMEEQGNYYVYVQVSGESYIKRTVTPGFTDGLFTNVVSGLAAGDRVVTKGAIFVKASSQMTGTPSHGHEH